MRKYAGKTWLPRQSGAATRLKIALGGGPIGDPHSGPIGALALVPISPTDQYIDKSYTQAEACKSNPVHNRHFRCAPEKLPQQLSHQF